MKRYCICWVIMAGLFAASCAHLPEAGRVKTPLVSLADVRSGAVGVVGMTMDTKLQIENPNGFPVTIPYVNYDLYLNDMKCGRGTSSKKLKVKAYSIKKVDVPIQLTFLDMVGSLARTLQGKSGSYGIAGELVIKTSGGDRSFPFKKTGKVNFSKTAATGE